MEVSNELKQMYGNYYLDEKVLQKRKISARQSVEHIVQLVSGRIYPSIIDIGAGDGSVLEELSLVDIGNEFHAVEISESGCSGMRAKKISKLVSITQFDGYKLPFNAKKYSLGLAIHVLEHVEHERAFLREIANSCDYLYVEVPLELTIEISRNIKIGAKYGHINYYNPAIFQNMLSTSGLEVVKFQVFSATLEYERFLSGALKGTLKFYLRSLALKLFPAIAPRFITYMGGALCRSRG